MEPIGDIPPDELQEHLDATVKWIVRYRREIDDYPVLPAVVPGDLTAALPKSPPAQAESFEQILQDFQQLIVPAVTHWNHPGFLGYFANSGSGPGIVGEALTAALNVNGMLWRSCPAATELETLTLDWLRQMMGLPEEFEGHINDTASISTLVALAAAREAATGGAVRNQGLRGLPPLRTYASVEAHSSVDKAVISLGLGHESLIKIPVDPAFAMDPKALRRAIQQDLQGGAIPMAVVATVGTTATTAVDPLAEIASICAELGVWLHVDAAYGGAMALLPEHRGLFAGVERADSFVVNPHKWLFVPMDCSALYVRDVQKLRAAFSLVPSYLMTPEDDVARNLMDYGPALGRRFRALKLWMVIRAFGQEGMAARIRHHLDLARQLAAWAQAEAHWEVLAPVNMSLVLLRHHPPGMDGEAELQRHNEGILQRVVASGRVFLGHTLVGERYALRLALGNLGTGSQRVEEVWRLLVEEGART